MINMDDGTETKLDEIRGSKCHFHRTFDYQDYIIQLRLDWDDVVTGDPMLDADIWRKPKSKRTRLRNGPWHHSKKEYDAASMRNIYTFRFNSLKLRLGTKTTAVKDIKCDVRIRKAPEKQD